MTAKCTCIDFSSSIIRLPATHSGWSDFWDVGLAINERRRSTSSSWCAGEKGKKEPCPCLKGKAQTERNSRGTGDPAC